MLSSIRNRLIVIGGLIALSVFFLVPRNVTQRVRAADGTMKDTLVRRVPIKRGLDLQGGIYLALEIDESQGRVQDREGDLPCDRHGCGGMGEYIISIPTMHVWEADRAFMNISHHDEGMKFPTRAAYDNYLKDTHQAEVSTAAPSKHNRSAKTIMSFK